MSPTSPDASTTSQSTDPDAAQQDLASLGEPPLQPSERGSRLPASPVAWLVQRFVAARATLKSLRSIVRLQPFDTSTPEGRSKERYRRAALTTVASFVSRVLGIFTGLAWMRLSISYLGKERYGLWMAVGSLVAWANLADFGLARGMQNHLSQANGQDDRELAARYVSTGLFTLTGVAILCALISMPAVLFVPWSSVLNVKDPTLADETRLVVAAVLACFFAQFPLSLVPTIYSAYQRGYIAAIFNMLGSVFSLLMLFVVTRAELSLPWLVLVTSGTGIVMTLINFGFVVKEMPWLRPRLRLVSRATLNALAGTSVTLFVFQIGSLLVNETQSFIIARRLGLPRVAEWSVFMRVYFLPLILIQMIDSPLIPAFRESHVRGEHQWLRTAFWRVTKLKLVIAIIAAGLLVVGGNLFSTLIGGKEMVFSLEMWASSGFLLLVSVWNGSFNDLMIATDRLRLLVVTVLINGLVTIVLSYTLAHYFGLVGILLATATFSLVISAWLLPWVCRDLIADRTRSSA